MSAANSVVTQARLTTPWRHILQYSHKTQIRDWCSVPVQYGQQAHWQYHHRSTPCAPASPSKFFGQWMVDCLRTLSQARVPVYVWLYECIVRTCPRLCYGMQGPNLDLHCGRTSVEYILCLQCTLTTYNHVSHKGSNLGVSDFWFPKYDSVHAL